jgi:hypothetical protein
MEGCDTALEGRDHDCTVTLHDVGSHSAFEVRDTIGNVRVTRGMRRVTRTGSGPKWTAERRCGRVQRETRGVRHRETETDGGRRRRETETFRIVVQTQCRRRQTKGDGDRRFSSSVSLEVQTETDEDAGRRRDSRRGAADGCRGGGAERRGQGRQGDDGGGDGARPPGAADHAVGQGAHGVRACPLAL